MRKSLFIAAIVCLAGCHEDETRTARAEVHKLTGNTVQLMPTAGQLPYCLVFTVSERGTIRQLTMTHENKSVPCTAGQPIGGLVYRVPVDEGAVKVHIFFSDQKLNAASVAQQVLEIRDNPKWSQLDLRLPGRVNLETLEFTPSAEPTAAIGALIGDGGEAQTPDAGAAPAPDGGSPTPP